MPDTLHYDAAMGYLHVGTGVIENVLPAVWAYEISGVRVLTKWFSYRRRHGERPSMGRRVSRLLDVQPSAWLPDYTTDLIDLLNVLGLLIELEPRQAQLLDDIVSGPLLPADDLEPRAARRSARQSTHNNGTIPLIEIDEVGIPGSP